LSEILNYFQEKIKKDKKYSEGKRKNLMKYFGNISFLEMESSKLIT